MADSDSNTESATSIESIARAKGGRREGSRHGTNARGAAGRRPVFPATSNKTTSSRLDAFPGAFTDRLNRDAEPRYSTMRSPSIPSGLEIPHRNGEPALYTTSSPLGMLHGYELPVSMRDSETGGPFVSILSSNSQELVRRCVTFEEVAAFLRKKNLKQIDDGNTFLQDAASAYRSGPTSHADRCVRAAIILRKCNYMSRGEKLEFLEEIEDGDGSAQDDLDDLFVKVKERVMKIVPANASHHISAPTGSIVDRHAASIPRNTARLGFAPEERHASGTERNRILPTRPETVSFLSSHSAPTSRMGPGTSDGSADRLDERYNVRESGFFKVGRVFALLWHQGMGSRPGAATSQLATSDRFGETIITHIQRMVIVREQQESSWCVPINTYAGRGVAKKGIYRRDVQSHTIIHQHDMPPYAAEDEPTLTKKPLAVRMAASDQRLDRMSRVNFGKVHTVEHNVKVMNVGMIAPASMIHFKEQWKAELRRDLD